MPRRVVMIIADDWSPIAKCYGQPNAPTPHIDRFAERATVFHRAYCTTPTCGASRASILTGLHSHQHGQYGHCHGIHGFRTHADVVSLPELCRRAGVRGELIGKNHTAPASVYPWDDRRWPKEPTPDGWRTAVTEALRHDGPTFTMVAPLYPHRGGPDGWSCHEHADAFGDGPIDPAQVAVPDFLPDLPQVRADLAGYWRAIGRFDRLVGAVLDAVTDTGATDETLVILTSDHPMPFPGAKASCYDTGHRCPLLIHRPGGGQAQRLDVPVNWLDYLPTIRQWLELPVPGDGRDRRGASLLDWLDVGGAVPGDRRVCASHNFHEVTMYDPYRWITDGRWKFVQRLNHLAPMPMASDIFDSPTWRAICHCDIRQLGLRPRDHYIHRPAEALYDLAIDPMETTNVSHQNPRITCSLRDDLMAERIATADPWLMIEYQRGDASVRDKTCVQR